MRLLKFPRRCIHVPIRGGQRWNLAKHLNHQLAEESDPPLSWAVGRPTPPPKSPLQLGYGTPLGAEATVHASRLYLLLLPPDHVLLQLDFRNAFNTVRRDKILSAARDMVPEIFPFIFAHYSAPSTLFFRETTILSAEGVQQGDPLGPLLFSLVIHPLVLQLRSELCIFYLDNGFFGWP